MNQKSNAIEYSVYTFDGKSNGKRKASWQKKMTSENMQEALQEAEKLYESKQYGRVEVKKKYYDPKNARTVDMSLKIFENKPKKPVGLTTILAGGLICAVLAFLITYTYLSPN